MVPFKIFDFQYDPKEVRLVSSDVVVVGGYPHVALTYEPVQQPTPMRSRRIELVPLEWSSPA